MTGINNLQTVFGGAAAAGTDETSASRATAPNTSGTDAALTAFAGKDQTVVSSTAGALRQGMDADDVRMDKVEQLKSAINSGTYRVATGDVADRLLSNMLGGK